MQEDDCKRCCQSNCFPHVTSIDWLNVKYFIETECEITKFLTYNASIKLTKKNSARTTQDSNKFGSKVE